MIRINKNNILRCLVLTMLLIMISCSEPSHVVTAITYTGIKPAPEEQDTDRGSVDYYDSEVICEQNEEHFVEAGIRLCEPEVILPEDDKVILPDQDKTESSDKKIIQKSDKKTKIKKNKKKNNKNTKKKTDSKTGLEVTYRDEIVACSKEKNILYRIVEAEAGGEDISGRILVAHVVINRMKSSEFPDTIQGVVFDHSGNTYQFSPIKDGRYYSVDVSKTTKKAVNKALDGFDNSSGATYFICRSLADPRGASWFDRALKYLFRYGCHEFFS